MIVMNDVKPIFIQWYLQTLLKAIFNVGKNIFEHY
jgi:hypothetical protein